MNAKIAKTEIAKHLPQILSITSCIGVGLVAYFSGKNTLKAKEILDAKKAELGEEKLPAKEVVKSVWKPYIPTVAAMAVTVGTMIASERVSAAQVASMTAACGYMALRNRETAKIISGTCGSEKAAEIKEQALAETSKHAKVDTTWDEPTGNGDLLCYESYSGRLFRSSEAAVNDALRKFKDYYETELYISMNDLYDFLGIKESYFGNEFGWCRDQDTGFSLEDISFNCYYSDKLVPGENAYIIEFENQCYFPDYTWMEC